MGLVGTEIYIVGASIARPFFAIFRRTHAFPSEGKVSAQADG